MDINIASRAIADRKIDEKYGTRYSNSQEGMNERNAEQKRLLEEYEASGEGSEIGRALARMSRKQ